MKKKQLFHILEIDPLLIETAIEIVNYKTVYQNILLIQNKSL